MLNRAFEWYRIVNVQPVQSVLDNRIASAKDLIKSITSAKNWDVTLAWAAGVAAGFDVNFRQDSPAIVQLVAAIKAHDAVFPEDLTENALELRACAALALGEIVAAQGKDNPSQSAIGLAAVLRSGINARPLPRARYLKQMLEELDAAAARTLQAGAAARRDNPASTSPFAGLKDEPPADLPTVWKSLLPALKKSYKQLTHQAAIDREELNVLWWLFGGASGTVGQRLAEMDLGAAALCAGAELADLSLVPPSPNTAAILRRALEADRPPGSLKEIKVDAIAGGWTDAHLACLIPDEEAVQLAKANPTLFPLCWLAVRLRESQHAKGWIAGFEQATAVPRGFGRTPTEWAGQVLRERIACRAVTEGAGE